IVAAWIPAEARRPLDDYKRIAESFNHAGAEARAAGRQFAYHNHDFEFVPLEGRLPYDVLLAETDPQLVQLEIDLYWITKGGQDPLAYFARWPGRVPLVHVKDSAGPPEHRLLDVGAGAIERIPLPDLCRAAAAMGLAAIDLLGPDDWERVRDYGVVCSMGYPAIRQDFIATGFNDPANHALLLGELETAIPLAARHGVPNL